MYGKSTMFAGASVLALLLLSGCRPQSQEEAAREAAMETAPRKHAEEVYRERMPADCPGNYQQCTVDVHYGTNRKPGPGAQAGTPNDYYGEEDGGELELGTLTVSFPWAHVSGAIERPRWYKLEFEEDPEKHVMIRQLEPGLEAADWLERVKATAEGKGQRPPTSQAFVFVHGYNTRFAAAAWRAAQIAYDLDFDGVPMLYSWPSVGGGLKGLLAYETDEEQVALAVPHFRRFIRLVADSTGLESVHVIAHSMGNRLVTTALDKMYREDEQPPSISQLVLAAPDVDTELFASTFIETLPRLARRVTIYASSKDKALNASELKHGQGPRLGDAKNDRLWALEGVDRIDASFVADTLDSGEGSKEFLQHSYFARNDSVSSDLLCLLRGEGRQSLTPRSEGTPKRPLLTVKTGVPVPDAWNLKPTAMAVRGDC